MYKSRYLVDPGLVDESGQKIFVPYTLCYSIHSIVVLINGLNVEEGTAFCLNDEFFVWKPSAGYRLERTDRVVLEINYFYKTSWNDISTFSNSLFAVDSTVQSGVIDKRRSIFSKHYIDGQFALDNGLYKESVMDFGTALETILNSSLEKIC